MSPVGDEACPGRFEQVAIPNTAELTKGRRLQVRNQIEELAMPLRGFRD
jgi:hypothetical protein